MKKIYIIILLLILPGYMFSQISDSKYLFAAVEMTPVKDMSSFSSTEPISASGAIGTQAHVKVGYIFKSLVGLSCGIGVSNFKSELSLDNFNQRINNLTDGEGDNYNLIINADNYKEEFVASTVDLPISLLFRAGKGKTSFFFNPGIKLSLSTKGDYSASAVYTYDGEYYEYNITLSDLDYYGFAQNKSESSSGKTNTKASMNLIVATGLEFAFGKDEKMAITAGVYYERGITNISRKDDNFALVKNVISADGQTKEFTSMSSNCDEIKLSAVGLQLGFKYYIW